MALGMWDLDIPLKNLYVIQTPHGGAIDVCDTFLLAWKPFA
jgi:hypothetical protein